MAGHLELLVGLAITSSACLFGVIMFSAVSGCPSPSPMVAPVLALGKR